jgi:hypothetical protein
MARFLALSSLSRLAMAECAANAALFEELRRLQAKWARSLPPLSSVVTSAALVAVPDND